GSTSWAASSPTNTFRPDREVRFAAVMYGGVSLAIYINGVAQELLNIVRATAPLTDDPDETRALLEDEKLTGAEKVYRKLGRYLREDHKNFWSDKLDPAAPIKTRFV